MDIKKVLVADAVDSACTDLLKKHGIQVDCKYKLPKDQLIKEIPSYDGLIVRSDTKVSADVIAAATNLKVIGRAGAGVDTIDVAAATNKNVLVLNTPGGNSISACELTCALITNLARNVAAAADSLKAGRWDRKLYSGHELYGKTLAIIGLGRIGKEVAIRMQSWGMRTIGFDPIVSAEEARQFNVESLSLEQIWPQADYITVHTPLIPQTRNLINSKVFNVCKKGVRIVNVARGGIISEADLLEALKSGQCGGAALDVFEQEPPTDAVTLELIKHPKVVATPHLGASTTEAQIRVAVEISEQFIALTGKSKEYTTTPGVVNRTVLENLKKN
ncbi:D-3-phosphoglycerate dehydrogenase [Aethina tumida]|uniref:D-3-phosphoglycerate dehydrogenase n=1 Tax=Aethina tumida TaxID=116153 RepID=UPI002147600D|nr:D-3-phosphoglycerate dehydrogenase [Aethina tumida]